MELCPHIGRYLVDIDRMVSERMDAEREPAYDIVRPFIMRSGKKIRPALCLLSCGASGGRHEDAVEGAAIIEIVHNVTLIHDDAEDGSRFRRGQPTLHTTYGLPTAINSADALFNFAWGWMLGLPFPAQKVLELQRMYAGYVRRMVRGQGMEIGWIRDRKFDVSEGEYLSMVQDKTAALMELACENGAFFSGSGGGTAGCLKEFGRKLGIAFQIQDDVLNITGDFDKYRKEIGGDISEGKRTLMVVHCMHNGSEGIRARLKEILSSHTSGEEEVAEAVDILHDCGSLEYARGFARRMAEEAKLALGHMDESEDKRSLIRIAEYAASRDE